MQISTFGPLILIQQCILVMYSSYFNPMCQTNLALHMHTYCYTRFLGKKKTVSLFSNSGEEGNLVFTLALLTAPLSWKGGETPHTWDFKPPANSLRESRKSSTGIFGFLLSYPIHENVIFPLFSLCKVPLKTLFLLTHEDSFPPPNSQSHRLVSSFPVNTQK